MACVPAKLSELDLMVPAPWQVRRVIRETADTFTIHLQTADGTGQCDFRPGQFNMLYAPGIGEAPISISGDPRRPEVLVHTVRAVGAVTRALTRTRPQGELGVRGPFGSCWPTELPAGSDVVIICGGIGLAPLRPLVYHVLHTRGHFNRVALLYGARTPHDMLFRKELLKWGARFDFQVHATVDRAAEDWRGSVGVVTALIPHIPFDPANTVAMICGPEIMMRFSVMALLTRGLHTSKIHLSMERNMKCGFGMCGHCQFGPEFVCRDGPVFPYERVERLLAVKEA